MARVTICFAAPDAERAERVAAWAADRGFAVDRLTDADADVRARLIDTDALLHIMTSAWMASPACRAVFREAQSLRLSTFPVMAGAAGELVVGSDVSRLTLSDGEAGLEWLSAAIDGAARAVLAGRSAFRFCAFLSYSHRDKREATWLHRKIEAFRMPKALVGRTTAFGRVGRRLGKAFRDDEELQGAANLDALIEGALAESETLVVLCSPHAARSAYVNDEIADFQRLGRQRIIPVIIDGRPHDPDRECFPPALTHRDGTGGLLPDAPAEPLAVDLREHGRRRTLLKVIAGITGLDFDELERRERRRRSLQLRTVAATILVLLGVVLGIGAGVERNVGRQAMIDRAAKVLTERQPVLAANLALAGLSTASDLGSAGREAVATLKASGYAFPTRILDPGTRFADFLLTADGKRLITRGLDGAVRIWDVERGTPVADLNFNHYTGDTVFEGMDLSPDENRLLLSSETGTQLWDARSGQWIADLAQADVRSATFSGGGRWIVALLGSGSALLDASTGDRIAEYGTAAAVKASADGSRVVTELPKVQTVVLWDGPAGRRMASLGTGGLIDVSLASDGTRVAVLHRAEGSVTLWDGVRGQPVATLQGNIDRMEMSADGKRIATASLSGEPLLWDTADGRRIGVIGPEGSDRISFSKSGEFVVAYPRSGTPVVSDARTGARIAEVGSFDEGAGGLIFVPGRQRVVLLTKSVGLVLRDSRTGAFVAPLAEDNNGYGLQISDDGTLLQAKDANHAITLWDGRSGATIGALAATREGHGWTIDRNNDHAVTRGIDGTLRLRRIVRGADPSPAMLRDRVCRANRELLGAFPAAERNADTPAGHPLRGRPWHACDWRGLGSIEGWLQLTRYWGTRAGLPWDYKPAERSALDQ